MRRLLFTPDLSLLAVPLACTYEYKLQNPVPGGVYALTVAGHSFDGDTVGGNCSYYTVSAGSGRVGHSTRTYHYNTCTWDLYGKLLSLTPVTSAPVAPPPLSTNGTETVYATNGTSTTGHDSRGFGFVTAEPMFAESAISTWMDGTSAEGEP